MHSDNDVIILVQNALLQPIHEIQPDTCAKLTLPRWEILELQRCGEKITCAACKYVAGRSKHRAAHTHLEGCGFFFGQSAIFTRFSLSTGNDSSLVDNEISRKANPNFCPHDRLLKSMGSWFKIANFTERLHSYVLFMTARDLYRSGTLSVSDEGLMRTIFRFDVRICNRLREADPISIATMSFIRRHTLNLGPDSLHEVLRGFTTRNSWARDAA